MNSEESFFLLSPDRVLEAVESAQFLPSGQCQPIYAMENRVYLVVLENGTKVIAKFYRPGRWSEEQILEEHEFLFAIEEDEIPVCAPMRFYDGSTLKKIGNIFFTLWPVTGGREPSEFSDTDLEILGRMLARIHNIGAVKPFIARRDFNAASMINTPLHYIDRSGLLPESLLKDYKKLAFQTEERFHELSIHIPVLRIHGDCHINNILLNSGGWHFLDFDDSCNGPAVQDLWMLIQKSGSHGIVQMNTLLEGYRQFRPFENMWLNLIEPLRAMRIIHYSGWIARRISDPAFTAAFPHFGSEEYWHNEIKELSETVRKFPFTWYDSFDATEEVSLENKDIFWDWEEK